VQVQVRPLIQIGTLEEALPLEEAGQRMANSE